MWKSFETTVSTPGKCPGRTAPSSSVPSAPGVTTVSAPSGYMSATPGVNTSSTPSSRQAARSASSGRG